MDAMRLSLLLVLLPLPALAQDIAEGERQFARQCISCHVVATPAREVLAGRTARTGPNLYGIAGRLAGSRPDFNYSDSLAGYGAAGAVWAEGNAVPYLLDPTGFLREALGDRRARSKMAYQVRDESQARDIWAYLVTIGAP